MLASRTPATPPRAVSMLRTQEAQVAPVIASWMSPPDRALSLPSDSGSGSGSGSGAGFTP